MGFASDTPHVEIVHIDDALNYAHRFGNFVQADPAGCPLEQDVQTLTDDSEGRPENQGADSERQRRIHPGLFGLQDDPPA